MTLNIGGISYDLYFGLDFIDYLDKIYYVEERGLRVGQGLAMAVVNAETQNPVTLLHLIKAATETEKSKPSTKSIKEFLETEANYEELYSDFLSELERAHTTEGMMKKLAGLSNSEETKTER